MPVINSGSARLLEDSVQVPGRFLQRQRFFHNLKQQRIRVLQAEVRPAASWTCAAQLAKRTFSLPTRASTFLACDFADVSPQVKC